MNRCFSRTPHRRSACIALLGSALAPVLAPAAVVFHCVSDSNQLQAALTGSAADGNTDFVLLAPGTYVSPSGGFTALVQGKGDLLLIAGGFVPDGMGGCGAQSRSGPRQTVIDGGDANPGFTIHGDVDGELIAIQNISVVHGRRDATEFEYGGGVSIDTSGTFPGNILIERVIFRGNVTSDSGALNLDMGSMTGTVTLRNNLFVDNQADNAAAFRFNGNAASKYVIGNTFANNTAANLNSLIPATLSKNGGNWGFSNNIFWGNLRPDQYDFVAAPSDLFADNDVEVLHGTPAIQPGAQNLAVDPQFRSDYDFHLRATSPLIDAGVTAPAGGVGSDDLDGMPRVVGGKIDYGVYGHDVLLIDSFD
jgi:hypothetical protein